MGFLWALLGFAVTIGIIVLVHEAGHLLAAKSLNVEVRRFSIGFGPVLWKRKWGETEYAVSLVPLGGYVQMTGENGTAEPVTPEERARSYDAQSKPRRALILAAGPLMNFVLAFFCYVLLGAIGVEDLPVRLLEPPAKTAAAQAGVVGGDLVTEVDGVEIRGYTDLNLSLLGRIGEETVPVTLKRGEGSFETQLDLSTLSLTDAAQTIVAAKLGFIPQMTGPLVIANVMKDGPGEKAGLRAGDKVLTMAGRPVATVEDFRAIVAEYADRDFPIEVESLADGSRRTLTLHPEMMTLDKAEGAQPKPAVAVSIGRLPETIVVHYGPIDSVRMGAVKLVEMLRLQVMSVGQLAQGEGADQIAGPVGIAQSAGTAVRAGLRAMVDFVALISVAVGFMNLIPIPGLDGGHLFVMSLEALRRKDFASQTKEKIMKGGLFVVLLIMVFALNNDLTRLFS